MSMTIPLAICHSLLRALKTHLVDGSTQEELLGLCLNAAGMIVRSDRAVGYWFDKDGELDPIVRSGLPMVESKVAARRLADQVVANDMTIWVPDLVKKRWVLPVTGQPVRGMLGVPMRLVSGEDTRVIGVMCFERDPGPVEAEASAFLEWIGEMVASSVRHGLQERQQRLQFDQLLDQVNRLGAMLQIDMVAQRDAVVDAESGLVNRAFLEHHCPLIVAMAHRYRFPLSGVLVEVSVAESPKVSEDDRRAVLADVAKQVLRCARSCDTVAQLGEQTLFTLVPHTDLEGAKVLGDRIQRIVRELKWPHSGGPVRIVVGIAQLQAGQDGQALLAAADTALQLAAATASRRAH